jgi:hypothetical protein
MPQFKDAIEFSASPQWDDIMATIPAPTSAGGGTPTSANFGVGSSIRVLQFGVGDNINGSVQFTHGYEIGSSVQPHVHWSPINTNTGNVRWSLDYYWLNINEGAIAAPTTIIIEQAGGGSAFFQQIANFPLVAGPLKNISSLFMFRLSRVAATAPEYNTDAALLAFDIHYRRDTVGSRQVLAK